MPNKEYIIVKEESIELLELKVNEHMMSGYVPSGGIEVMKVDLQFRNLNYYIQAMIKKY